MVLTSPKVLLSPTLSANLSKAAYRGLAANATTIGLRSSYSVFQPACRSFSTSRKAQLEYFEPVKNLPNIKLTPPQWPHPPVKMEQLKAVEIAHREPRSFSDRLAWNTIRLARWGMDFVTGYKHTTDNKPIPNGEARLLSRFIFLECIAGVPGMMGGMIRHFHSLRRMKRDNAWIETLLEDAYNERMHLLTFLTMAKPGWFMKMMILGAQGVFSNVFFCVYLLAPKFCHRLVGYLEEEATKTYTVAIEDLEAGKLPKWENLGAPEIAIAYWNMPEGQRTMKDLLYYIRADEAKHREIHHTFGNLDQANDPNPFASEYKDTDKPHPGRGIEYLRSEGWERKDVI